MAVKTPTTVKNEVRKESFEVMKVIYSDFYGQENVFVTGDSELSIKARNAPTGEPIYFTVSPTVKDYCDRTTKSKTVKAYDINKAVAEYNSKVTTREEKAEEAKVRKEAKIKRDTEAREKAKAEREKAKEEKA